MPTEKILFTACPQGVSGGKRVLRVHLAPQLSGGTVLSQFPALREWPTTAQKLALKITAGGAPVVIKPTLDTRALELWKALFPPATTPVTSFEVENLSTRFIMSYPASLVGTTILLAHTGLAASADTGLPNAANLGKVLFPLLPPSTIGTQRIGFDPNRAIEQVKAKYARGAVAVPTGGNPTDLARESFFLGRAFHGVRNPKPTNPTGKKTLDDLDFHGIVGQLAEYPELLEKLGLIFEVALPAGNATEVFVEPVWAAGSPAVTAVSPRTQVSTAFYPKGNARIVDGFVDLKTPANGYAVANFDIDGALHQFVSLAESLFNANQRKSLDTPDTTGLAPLRSSGLSLLQFGRAAILKAKLNAAQQMKSQGAPTLEAELLNRGWRVDVRDYTAGKTSPWLSLCERIGSYSFPKAPTVKLDPITDEGSIRTAVTEQPGHPELYLHESLFNWDGWSLCAPRPNKPVPDEGPPSSEAPPLALKTAFEARPGSLPRLRFGRLYQFRLRAVDLSGGGRVASDKGGEAQASIPVPYGRYEPVPPPVVILQKFPGAGESTERLVIRSLGPGDNSGENCVRHVAPPRVSVDMAVTHGVLDDKTTGKPDLTKIGLIHSQDAEYKEFAIPDVFNPSKPERASKAIMVPENEATIPYLPDPLCSGAILRGNSGNGELPFATGEWPNKWQTFHLRLKEGMRGVNVVGREIIVTLPKGERGTFRLSSKLHTDAYKQMALWQWIEIAKTNGTLTAARYDTLKDLAQKGGHWMLTPGRTITMVHAVLQPLEAPVVLGLSAVRVLSSPTFHMPGSLTCDAKSTGQIDMTATWEDRVDNPNTVLTAKTLAELPTRSGRASLFSLPLRFPNEEVPSFGGNVDIKGKDGKTIAEWEPTNKRVYFTEAILNADGDPPLVTMPDTRYHQIRCTATASTRFREYFLPKDIAGKPTTQVSKEVIVDVPNATPPAPPEIAFIVPTFGWERTATTSKRTCGLRVYLERPWFSSGDGELLAVVCATGAPQAVLEPHVTQLGSDPLWLGATLPRYPAPGQFTSRLRFTEGDSSTQAGTRILPKDFVTTGLAAYGIATTSKVQVAAFSVLPDPALNLWYADIEVETDTAYLPFIRLALARYQPRSVKDAHLSAIRTTDFAQLLPDRSLSVTKQANSWRVSVSGTAPNSTVFEASLERLSPEAGDLEWKALGNVMPMERVSIAGRGTVYGALVPQADTSGGKLRLAIREWEVYPNGRRLVYAENWPV